MVADPTTYTLYGTTIPVIRNLCNSAISILTSAQTELAANPSAFPTEQEILDTNFGNMYPLRSQPLIFARFTLVGLKHLSLLPATVPIPSITAEFSSLQDVITYFASLESALAAIDAAAFNASAEKSIEIPFESFGKTVTMRGLADYCHGFLLPHDYFHVNAIYMLLRSRGFALGKKVYVGPFLTESLKEDWAALGW